MRPHLHLSLCVWLAVALTGPGAAAQTETRSASRETPAAAAVAQSGRFYALIIGINDYPAPMPKLKTPVHDAEAIAAVLHDRYGFEVKLLLEASATRANILNAITRYQATLSENDSLLIYYAGHGYSIRNPDKTYDKAYWLPVDADSPNSPNRIIADDLTTDIRLIPARHVLIISDSCYAGGLSREGSTTASGAVNAAYLKKMAAGRSRNLMASGGDEPVADGGPDGHSIFAAAILRALNEASEPMMTAGYLFYDVIRPVVGGSSGQLPQYEAIRNSGHESGDFVFVLAQADHAVDPMAEAIRPAGASSLPRAASSSLPQSEDLSTVVVLPTSLCEVGESLMCTKTACDAGDSKACQSLQRMIIINAGELRRLTVKEFAAEARKDCDARVGSGCVKLGVAYAAGSGVKSDVNHAAALFERACDLEEGSGCRDLAVMYQNGTGVGRDAVRAAALYGRACDNGEETGCRFLGISYEQGLGVAMDRVQALAAYRRACELKDQLSCAAVKRLQP